MGKSSRRKRTRDPEGPRTAAESSPGTLVEDPRTRRMRILREYVQAFALAIILALFVRWTTVQAFRIPSESMEDTLLVGDFLLVNKFLYGIKIPGMDLRLPDIREPQRGDIIIFPSPDDTRRNFIKRCMATPGDTVEIRNNVLHVNGEPIEEDYAKLEGPTPPQGRHWGPVIVPEGRLLMLGDNRNNSNDSRYWGFADRSKVVGKAMVIYWSWDSDRFRPRFKRIGRIIR